MYDIELQLEAIKMVQSFCQWMILVQGGLLATYARWVITGAIIPKNLAKALTFLGFGGALAVASLRIGFLSDMTQRLGTEPYISDLAISHNEYLQGIEMAYLGVPQYVLFFVGLSGFMWSAWQLGPKATNSATGASSAPE